MRDTGGQYFLSFPGDRVTKPKKVRRLEIQAGFRRRQTKQSLSLAVIRWMPFAMQPAPLYYLCVSGQRILTM